VARAGRRARGVARSSAGALRVRGSVRAGWAGHVEGARPARGRDRWRGRSPERVGSRTGPSRGAGRRGTGGGGRPALRRGRCGGGGPERGGGGTGRWRGAGRRGTGGGGRPALRGERCVGGGARPGRGRGGPGYRSAGCSAITVQEPGAISVKPASRTRG